MVAQAPLPLPAWLMSAAHWAVFLCGVVAAYAPWTPALWLGAAAAVLLFVARFRSFDATIKGLICLAALLALISYYGGLLSSDLVAKTISGGLSLGAFCLSLQFLTPAIERSDLVEKVGRQLVRQPAGRRYYAISFGVNVTGILLSISVIPLFLTMMRLTLEESEPPLSDTATRTIRRRSASAIQRGFSMVPLWSPISVTIVVLAGLIPDLSWFDFLPFGLALSVALVWVGRQVDRLQNPATKSLPGFSTRFDPKPLFALFAILALVPTVAWLASDTLSAPRLLGLLLAFPIVGLMFFALQSILLRSVAATPKPAPRNPSASTGFFTSLHDQFTKVGREFSVFVLIGLISALAVPVFRTLPIAETLSALPIPPVAVLFACVVLGLIISVFGVSPLITAVLLVDLFVQPGPLSLPSSMLILAATFLVGHSWLVSPAGYGTMTTARYLNVPTRQILVNWNLPYVLCAVLVFGLLLAAISFIQ